MHVPFCEKRCFFCDFYTLARRAETPEISFFVDKIIQQGEWVACELGNLSFSTVFVGGGTPSFLALPLLKKLLESVSRFDLSQLEEFSVECNPESLDLPKIRLMQEAGVDRISLGLQSFNETLLSRVGRPVTYKTMTKALDLLQKHWHGRLSVDCISGLPFAPSGQTQKDLKELMNWDISHISLYAMTLEKKSAFGLMAASGKLALPDFREAQDEWLAARAFLLERGFSDYEISNFCKTDADKAIHNMAYWNLRPYLGLGPGAVSTLWEEGRVVRYKGRSLKEFLASGSLGGLTFKETISPVEFLKERLMMGLRLKEGISVGSLGQEFGQEIAFWARKKIQENSLFDGDSQNALRLKNEQRLFLDSHLASLFQEIDALKTGLTLT